MLIKESILVHKKDFQDHTWKQNGHLSKVEVHTHPHPHIYTHTPYKIKSICLICVPCTLSSKINDCPCPQGTFSPYVEKCAPVKT